MPDTDQPDERPDTDETAEEGQVSEVASMGDAPEPIQPDQAVAGSPDDVSGDADEGTAGPDAKPEVSDSDGRDDPR